MKNKKRQFHKRLMYLLYLFLVISEICGQN